MAGGKSFITSKKYAEDMAGQKHFDHVLGLLPHQENIPVGGIEVFGDINIMKNQKKIRARAGGCNFLEIMTYAASDEEIKAVTQYLSDTLGRDIVAVRHNYESAVHTHFLIPWRDINGRALRLTKGELFGIQPGVAKVLGQNQTKKGQGRKMLSLKEYAADPAAAQVKINEQKKENDNIKSQVAALLQIYPEISIQAISKKGRFEIQKINDAEQVNCRRLHGLSNQNGIYFLPVAPVAVFLDDIPVAQIPKLPSNALVIQTSRYKFQAHIPIPQTLLTDADALTVIQKRFARVFECDLAATAWAQPRRLPGFKNSKYNDPDFKVNITDLKPTGEPLVGLLTGINEMYKEQQQQKIKLLSTNNNSLSRVRNIGIKKTWQDFACEDSSRADFSYVLYLLSAGMPPEEIKQRIEIESVGLFARKGGQAPAEAYIERTIANAKRLFVPMFTQEQVNQIGQYK